MYLEPIFSALFYLFMDQNSQYETDEVFTTVGVLTIIITLLTCVLFFVIIGRWKPVFHKTVHWVITLVLLAIGMGILADTLGYNSDGDGVYSLKFGVFNAIYTALYFFLFSLLFKRFSVHAKYTPF